MKRIFSKKAFTLAEVIIATAITGLLIASVVALFGPVNKIINNIEGDLNINNITDTIHNYIYTKINKSISYNIDIYSGDNEAKNYSQAASIGYRIDTMIDSGDPSVTTYCILLKYKDGGYYVYDLGKVTSGLNYDNKYNNLSSYRVFNEEYYNNINFRFTFETLGNPENDREWWCSFGVTPYDEYDMPVIETRKSLFRMLNAASKPQSEATLKSLDEYYFNLPVGDTPPTIAIIYNIKNYLDLNHIPTE